MNIARRAIRDMPSFLTSSSVDSSMNNVPLLTSTSNSPTRQTVDKLSSISPLTYLLFIDARVERDGQQGYSQDELLLLLQIMRALCNSFV